MLYSEFVAGTGCKENDHNYKVYKDLEVMYTNSDLSKQDIYEYGKKLVDNSKSEEQIAFEAKINAEIAEYKSDIESLKAEVQRFTDYMKTEDDVVWKMTWRDKVRSLKSDISRAKARINQLKWVIE